MKTIDHCLERVSRSIESSIATHERLLGNADVLAAIAAAGDVLVAAMHQGRKVLLCGNGGSAADAQHIAAEFVGKFLLDRPALPAVVLTGNTSSLTAIG